MISDWIASGVIFPGPIVWSLSSTIGDWMRYPSCLQPPSVPSNASNAIKLGPRGRRRGMICMPYKSPWGRTATTRQEPWAAARFGEQQLRVHSLGPPGLAEPRSQVSLGDDSGYEVMLESAESSPAPPREPAPPQDL